MSASLVRRGLELLNEDIKDVSKEKKKKKKTPSPVDVMDLVSSKRSGVTKQKKRLQGQMGPGRNKATVKDKRIKSAVEEFRKKQKKSQLSVNLKYFMEDVDKARDSDTAKANVDQGKKDINKTFEEFQQIAGKLQESLSFIEQGMDHLQRHNLPSLSEVSQGGGRAASMVTLTASGGVMSLALATHSQASGLMEGLALGIDLQFAKKKQVLESGLATKIRKLTEELKRGVDKLYDLFKHYR